MIDDIISNGTEVLIFPYYDICESLQNNNTTYEKGIVVFSTESDDLALNGSPYSRRIYKIVKEDGTFISAVFGYPSVLTNYYIRTKEFHIVCLTDEIFKNQEEITKLKNRNAEISKTINLLANENIEKSILVNSK